MKTLYIECQMGAAGDMLMAALLELHPHADDFLRKLNALGIPGAVVQMRRESKCGIEGTRVAVSVNGEEEESRDTQPHEHHHHNHAHHHHDTPPHTHENEHTHGDGHGHVHARDGEAAVHHHAGMRDIEAVIAGLPIPEKARRDALAVYRLIAEAESRAHGKPVQEVHFHEVGAMDAVVDIVGVSWLLYELAPEQILASPVHVGSGQVECAHGILPVPAPATAYILRGVPTYGGAVRGELCTPTGAALLKHFVLSFAPQPVMCVAAIGYGMGKKDFAAANCVRMLIGETREGEENIAELRCNLDDMTPEAVGFAVEQLLADGALDVYVTSVQMKKNRPGVLLTCMCRDAEREKMVRLLFKYTTTLGVRESICNRYTLCREERVAKTAYGSVRLKRAFGWGTEREKAEYEDLARIAREQGLSLLEAEKKTLGN